MGVALVNRDAVRKPCSASSRHASRELVPADLARVDEGFAADAGALVGCERVFFGRIRRAAGAEQRELDLNLNL